VNERRAVEGLRFAADILTLVVKPASVEWIDSHGVMRTYSPDAKVDVVGGDKTLIEMKPKGVLQRNRSLEAKYEDIGRYLQHVGKLRFGLLEWQWDSTLARNVSRLSRYWNVEPGTHAVDAFDAIGDREVSLERLFERVDRENWPAVWAAVAKQHLTTDMHAEPLSRASHVSRPGEIYEPVLVDTLITKWWA